MLQFRRYQRDVFEPTMHVNASVALDGRDTLVLDGAQVVRFAEASGTNPDRFRYDEDPGRERAFESIGF